LPGVLNGVKREFRTFADVTISRRAPRADQMISDDTCRSQSTESATERAV
jgi:hypothetical protein